MPRIEIERPPVQEFPDFPLSFHELNAAWEGFSAKREFHRISFGEWLEHLLRQSEVSAIQATLTRPSGQPHPALLQRHFYWSATCFVRCFHLFLSYLVLDARGLYSWSVVTGYYSRFYFAKALTNLWLSTWVWAQRPAANGSKAQQFLLYTGPEGVRLLSGNALPPGISKQKSHGAWWSLFAQLQCVSDFPQDFLYTLSDRTFDQKTRDEVNYSDRWMEGFPELEWFDHTLDQMLAHASFAQARQDGDFTDLNQYFEGYSAEDADVADFYTDPVQSLWKSVMCYLTVLEQLPIRQEFITYEKLVALSERALGRVLPEGLEGIRRTLRGTLN